MVFLVLYFSDYLYLLISFLKMIFKFLLYMKTFSWLILSDFIHIRRKLFIWRFSLPFKEKVVNYVLLKNKRSIRARNSARLNFFKVYSEFSFVVTNSCFWSWQENFSWDSHRSVVAAIWFNCIERSLNVSLFVWKECGAQTYFFPWGGL